MDLATAGAPSEGGASSLGEAGLGGASGAVGSGGIADGGVNSALAGAGGAEACAQDVEGLPLGTFQLQVQNSVERCDRMDLTCSPEPERSGVGELTLTLSEWPGTRDGDILYINGSIATTLDLDGKGTTAESYQGMLVRAAGSEDWAGGFDLNSDAKVVSLWGDNCFNDEPGGNGSTVGHTFVSVDLRSGHVEIDRYCEDAYNTFSNVVKTIGGGTLVCR